MKRGFTLIELLVVIAIIGLLSTLSVVGFSTAREKARLSKGLGFEGQILRTAGDGLVGRWDFDDCSGTVAVDNSGLGNNASFLGTATWSTDTPSKSGCSASFDGDFASYVNVADNDKFSFIDNKFTISFWMKPATANAFYGVIGKGWGGYEYSFQGNGGNFYLGTWDTPGMGSIYNFPTTTYDTKWNHFVATADGTKLYFYKNGGLVSETTRTGTASLGNGAGYLALGAGYDGSGRHPFIGLLDSVRMYNRALSAKEIHQMYAMDLGQMLVSRQ